MSKKLTYKELEQRVRDIESAAHQLEQAKEAKQGNGGALENSSGILDHIFDNTLFLIAYMDPDFNFIRVNKAYAEAGNRPVDAYIGKNHFDLYPHEENKRVFQQVVQTGKTYTIFAKPFEHPDQPERVVTYWDFTLNPTFNKQGKINGILLALVDVTEQKQAEEALRESEESYRALSDASFEAIFISENGICLNQNQTAERMFGYTLTEAVGRPGIEWITPEDREQVKNNMLSNYEKPYQITALRKDGTTFPAEIQGKRVNVAGSRIRVTALRDITERKQAEMALKESSEKFDGLFSKVSAGIVFCKAIYDKNKNMSDCIYEDMNPVYEELTNLKKETAIGKKVSAMLSGTESEWFKTFGEVVKTGNPIKFEMYHKQSEKHYSVFAYNSNKDEFAAIFEDITDRRQAEAKIAASLKEKVVLLREIHHRVKNNMQVILSLLRMHSRRIKDANLGKIFEEWRDRINAMSLIHESLYQSEDLAQIDFKVYLKKLCRNMSQAYGASSKGIALTVGKCDVSLDMDQGIAIGMVISELVSNAFKHAFPLDKGGRVSINLSNPDERNIELIIEDNGKGMPPKMDIHNTTSLGLQLAVAAVTGELGGSIDVKRDNGTRFIIRFKYKSI